MNIYVNQNSYHQGMQNFKTPSIALSIYDLDFTNHIFIYLGVKDYYLYKCFLDNLYPNNLIRPIPLLALLILPLRCSLKLSFESNIIPRCFVNGCDATGELLK